MQRRPYATALQCNQRPLTRAGHSNLGGANSSSVCHGTLSAPSCRGFTNIPKRGGAAQILEKGQGPPLPAPQRGRP